MGCIALTTLALSPFEATMPTTEVTPAVNRKVSDSWLPRNTESTPVRVNWVVVIDKNGNRQLRIHWDATSKDDCAEMGVRVRPASACRTSCRRMKLAL